MGQERRRFLNTCQSDEKQVREGGGGKRKIMGIFELGSSRKNVVFCSCQALLFFFLVCCLHIHDKKRQGLKHCQPNQQRTLSKLPTELRCRNFVNKHQLSIQGSTKRAKTCLHCVCIPTELLFLHAIVGGWDKWHLHLHVVKTKAILNQIFELKLG